jgi:hypothetical protein
MADAREQRVLDAARTLVQRWDDEDGFGADIIEALREAVHALDRAPASPGEPPWLVKDFNVLYRAARRFADACHGRGEGGEGPYPAQEALDAQLERLLPAFEMTESARRAAREGFHDLRRVFSESDSAVLAAHEATKKAGEGD